MTYAPVGEDQVMFAAFFALAAQSPTRQATFRRVVVFHLVLVGCGTWALGPLPRREATVLLGNILLVAGIIEGAILVGWRLTQLPKCQALEFLLVSPLRPWWSFVSEAAVGLTQLALVTFSGLPVLVVLVVDGRIDLFDPIALLIMPCTWGALTGLGLTLWAYEPLGVRRWGERVVMAGTLVYLVIGVLAGENLRRWLEALPRDVAAVIFQAFRDLHTHNPFGVMRSWMLSPVEEVWERALWVEAFGVGLVLLCGARAAWRLQGHFRDLHYQPAEDLSGAKRPAVGEWPLTWWALKRVSRFSGRINLWLAWGFTLLYAAYLLAGAHWPAWMGRRIFEICDGAGGVAGLTTSLVLLAAVPAAFQYGLWDSRAQDRCRRLELLLLTELTPVDYWQAAAAAAWRRGRGYLAAAVVLWAAALLGARLGPREVLGGVAAAVLLWSLYFALGFRAFARGLQANGLGLLLSVALPLAAWGLASAGSPALAELLPPGMVYGVQRTASWLGLLGPLMATILTITVARQSLRQADAELRRWYDLHHGQKVAG
jgi:hypothetical protein